VCFDVRHVAVRPDCIEIKFCSMGYSALGEYARPCGVVSPLVHAITF